MKLVKENETNDNTKEGVSSHRILLRLNLLLGGAIALAMLLGVMCRRAEASPAVPGERVDIVGDIDENTALIVPPAIKAAGPNLTLYINSDGGLLDSAKAVMAALEARRAAGMRTKCYTTNVQSGAFMIFSACDERYITPYAPAMMHYAYITTSTVSLSNVGGFLVRLHRTKIDMDKWAETVFKGQAPLMKQYMKEERTMNGRELCNTFIAFCHTSYIFPILEN